MCSLSEDLPSRGHGFNPEAQIKKLIIKSDISLKNLLHVENQINKKISSKIPQLGEFNLLEKRKKFVHDR